MAIEIEQAFGFAIRKRRHELGWSQEKLASVAGIHRTYISLIERGYKCPSIRTVFKLAGALSIPAHKLILITEDELDLQTE